MKVRSLVFAVVLLVLGGAAGAQEMLIAPDTSGCQMFAPYAWVDLAPGATWQATVDLSKCTSSDLGWFYYYGYIAKSNGADFLKVQDGIALTLQNTNTGETFTPSADVKRQVNILLQVTQPATFRLSAKNTGRTTARISLTWVKFNKV